LGKELNSDMSALKKGKKMQDAVEALSFYHDPAKSLVFFTGIVDAEMKKLTYNIKLTVNKEAGDVENAHCECASGIKLKLTR
jgi:hypothetical protein